jgi:hypothetical protein
MQTVILPEGKSWNEIIAELEKRRDKEKYMLPTRLLVRLGRKIASFWPWGKQSKRWASPAKVDPNERWKLPRDE